MLLIPEVLTKSHFFFPELHVFKSRIINFLWRRWIPSTYIPIILPLFVTDIWYVVYKYSSTETSTVFLIIFFKSRQNVEDQDNTTEKKTGFALNMIVKFNVKLLNLVYVFHEFHELRLSAINISPWNFFLFFFHREA